MRAADLPGFHGHSQVVGQNGRVHHIGEGGQYVHGDKGSQHIVGVEVHIRGVGRVAAVQLELVGHIGLFLKNDGDLIVCELGVHLIGNGLHDALVPVVPNRDCDGIFWRIRRIGTLCGFRGRGSGALGRRLGASGQCAETQRRSKQEGSNLFHYKSPF